MFSKGAGQKARTLDARPSLFVLRLGCFYRLGVIVSGVLEVCNGHEGCERAQEDVVVRLHLLS
jgi:hypothetical protein